MRLLVSSRKSWCLGLALLLGEGSVALAAEDFQQQRAQVVALSQLIQPPKVHSADGFAADGDIRPLFFEGLPFRGQSTRVFAWYGKPATSDLKATSDSKATSDLKTASGKLPAVVLIHGGGGTAYKEWVKRWNDHGFAAISIAVEGQTDRPRPLPQRWERHAWPGPARVGIYGDFEELLADQWMYHAAADTILANSLLRSFAEIDSARIGLVGISWGGMVTGTVMGIDPRFAFAVPVYSVAYLDSCAERYQRALKRNDVYREVWEPGLRLPEAKMPTLWLTWLHDLNTPLDVLQKAYRTARGPRMVSVIPDMRHSHPAGWTPEDSYAFAESIVRDGKPWLEEKSQRREAGRVVVEWTASKTPERAILLSTSNTGFTGTRKWIESPATLEAANGAIRTSAELPTGTRSYFINLRCGSLTASSEYVEIEGN